MLSRLNNTSYVTDISKTMKDGKENKNYIDGDEKIHSTIAGDLSWTTKSSKINTINILDREQTLSRQFYCRPCTPPTPSNESGSFQKHLSKISNIASMLCVLDCTLLPAMTFIIPLFGIVSSPTQEEFLHDLGHNVALFFVLPLGGLKTTVNYLSCPAKSTMHNVLSMVAIIGLLLIYAANSGHDSALSLILPHELSHALHHGLMHRVVNITGCAMSLGSGYMWHKLGTEGDTCCNVTFFFSSGQGSSTKGVSFSCMNFC